MCVCVHVGGGGGGSDMVFMGDRVGVYMYVYILSVCELL